MLKKPLLDLKKVSHVSHMNGTYCVEGVFKNSFLETTVVPSACNANPHKKGTSSNCFKKEKVLQSEITTQVFKTVWSESAEWVPQQ